MAALFSRYAKVCAGFFPFRAMSGDAPPRSMIRKKVSQLVAKCAVDLIRTDFGKRWVEQNAFASVACHSSARDQPFRPINCYFADELRSVGCAQKPVCNVFKEQVTLPWRFVYAGHIGRECRSSVLVNRAYSYLVKR
jgi:hypothetical protein